MALNSTAASMRLEELEYVLNKKLSDKRVAAVHLLYNHPYTSHYMHTTRKIYNKHKLILHWVPEDPTHLDPLLYSNKYLLGRIVVFINQDVYLGEGFERMSKSALCDKNITYALSRYGKQEKYCSMPSTCGKKPYMGSHDTYIYCTKTPLPLEHFGELKSKSDHYGLENIWIWAFQQIKYKVLNPCYVLKTYHVHCLNFRNKDRKRLNTVHSGGATFGNRLE